MNMSDASDVTFTFDLYLYLIYCCQFPVIIGKYTNVCMINLQFLQAVGKEYNYAVVIYGFILN